MAGVEAAVRVAGIEADAAFSRWQGLEAECVRLEARIEQLRNYRGQYRSVLEQARTGGCGSFGAGVLALFIEQIDSVAEHEADDLARWRGACEEARRDFTAARRRKQVYDVANQRQQEEIVRNGLRRANRALDELVSIAPPGLAVDLTLSPAE